MKNLTILSAFLALTVLVSCKKLIPKGIYPYGMVQFEPGHFVDKTEITVEQYAEFVFDGNQDRRPKEEFSKLFRYHELFYPTHSPDSLYRALGKIDYYELPVVFEYFDTLNYTQLREILDYPITGISNEDAKAYTNWRTAKHNQLNTEHTKKGISFSLPIDLSIDIEQPVNQEKYIEKDIFIVYSEKHAKKTAKNIFGLQSNVEEITTENDKDAPKALVGFRCIATVIE